MHFGGHMTQQVKIDYNYAGLNQRMIAAILDTLFMMLTLMPVLMWISEQLYPQVTFENMVALLPQPLTLEGAYQAALASGMVEKLAFDYPFQALAMGAVFVLMWGYWSSSPGKMLMRMKIVDADTGDNMTVRQSIVRYMGYFVSGACFMLGILWIGIDRRKQGWHDKMANTVVVIPVKRKKQANVSAADESADL